jgi:alkylmercury lyase
MWYAAVDSTTFIRTGSINLARDLRGWGFPPSLGHLGSVFLVRMIREVAKGLPISREHLERLRAEVNLHPLEAELLVGRLAEFDDGHIVGIAGLSLKEYSHRVHVEDRTLFAWCPFDAFAAPIFFGVPVTIESLCPETRAPIRLMVTPNAVTSVEPETIVFRQIEIWPDEHPMQSFLDIQELFCARQYLFRDPEALVKWSRAKDDVDAGPLLPGEVLDLARLGWADIVRYTQPPPSPRA